MFSSVQDLRKRALGLLLLLGLVSLLGDIIYEGGRSVHGQYLGILGVDAVRLGFILGIGEFLGYFFRLLSGWWADKTRYYWFLTILGYFLLVSVPLIGLGKTWQIVAFLIILERIGKGVRTPARDTIASCAAKQIGTGYGFGIVEFIDQIGAIGGPLLFSLTFAGLVDKQNLVDVYKRGYSIFWLPFLVLLGVLFFTYFKFKHPEILETQDDNGESLENLGSRFWLYLLFVFLTTIGFVNFAFVGFHFKKIGLFPDNYIPLLYAGAMGIDAIFGLLAGKIYDQLGEKEGEKKYTLLLFLPLAALLVPFLVFSASRVLAILGVFFLGIGCGIQETIMKATVADLMPIRKRSGGYGVFNFSFGLALLLGSWIIGYLYNYSVVVLIFVLVLVEMLAVFVYWLMKKGKIWL